MSTTDFLPIFLAGALAFGLVGIVSYFRAPVYPPGPKGLPILGAALIHPKTEYWKTYAEWGRTFGMKGIISFHVVGRRMIVINSASVADELLNKRSVIYSDRPFPAMAGTLMKREKSIFYISHNPRFKMYRKLMHHSFNGKASESYWPVLEREARVMVDNMLRSPADFTQHIRRNSSAVIMKIAYGYSVEKDNDHFVAIAEEALRVGSLAGAPGRWLVDSFPILQYLPEWFPGCGFKRQAREWGTQLYTQSLEPHNFVKRELAAGRAVPSFTSTLLQPPDGPPADPEMEDIILWTAGALYAAGADTTVAATKAFVFIMTTQPDIQQRAQEEIDTVVGKERLPSLQDRASLPYVECILKEVLRWASPSPMGLFHCTATDDYFQGYYIPKKATVIANIWAMLHDADVYPEPMRFIPERFLPDSGVPIQPDPSEIAFGFGRRVCPGQHIAEASVFIQIATALATLEFRKAVDETGVVQEPEVAFTTAITSHIKPFKCNITPRSDSARVLLEHALDTGV